MAAKNSAQVAGSGIAVRGNPEHGAAGKCPDIGGKEEAAAVIIGEVGEGQAAALGDIETQTPSAVPELLVR